MSAPRDLIIIGASGFAREAAWIALQSMDHWNLLGYLDDNPSLYGKEIFGGKVLGTTNDINSYSNAFFVIAIGTPRVRKAIQEKLNMGVDRYATLIDPSVRKSNSVTVGAGSIICANVVATVNIEIGTHSIVNLNSTIGHDARLGCFNTIAPLCAISGAVDFHDLVEIGTGASVRQGIQIGSGAMLGMGGVAVSNIPAGEIWVGNPAKKLKSF